MRTQQTHVGSVWGRCCCSRRRCGALILRDVGCGVPIICRILRGLVQSLPRGWQCGVVSPDGSLRREKSTWMLFKGERASGLQRAPRLAKQNLRVVQTQRQKRRGTGEARKVSHHEALTPLAARQVLLSATEAASCSQLGATKSQCRMLQGEVSGDKKCKGKCAVVRLKYCLHR